MHETDRRRGSAPRVLVAAVLVLLQALPGPAFAAPDPYLHLTLVVSPNPAAEGDPDSGEAGPRQSLITLTGTVTPMYGTFSGVQLAMYSYYAPTSCTPVADCTIDGVTKTATWNYATISSKLTLTMRAPAAIGRTVGFAVEGCVPNTCMVDIVEPVTIKGPTMGATLTYAPSGVILPGEVLHFTVKGTTNREPIDADLAARFPAGLADPTNLTAGVLWDPGPCRCTGTETAWHLTSPYTFDAQVMAPIGTDLKMVLTVFPRREQNGTASKTVTLHVGAVATATPRPTPSATSKPPPGTPSPSPPLTSTVPTTSELQSSLATPSPSGSSASAVASPSGSAAPSQPTEGGPMSVETILVAVGAGGAGAAAFGAVVFLRRRRLRR